MRRGVTLPPGLRAEAQVAFAQRARHEGADLLELRSDLYEASEAAPRELAAILPLLVAERGRPLDPSWVSVAVEVDRELGFAGTATVRSLHAAVPLSTAEALAAWAGTEPGVQLKHIEPLGDLASAGRLLATQAALTARFGAGRVTVLATGRVALPFRAVLAAQNALDYLALEGSWAAAPGQRLLVDAVRAGSTTAARRGILGADIGHSRSPRIHRQPFDRLDLPSDTPIGPLLAALHPYYRGFAVTSPFKQAAAQAVGASLPAVNTLIRQPSGWTWANTDVQGAAAVLRRLGARRVTVLGDGGATVALRQAAQNRALTVVCRADVSGPLTGDIVWTWPAAVPPPAALRFRSARVAIVAYGLPGRRIADAVRRLGGMPVQLGACWFIAQARAQRRLWDEAKVAG